MRSDYLRRIRAALMLMTLCGIALMAAYGTAHADGSPQVTTDKSDYTPGSTAIITGSSFAANETVILQVSHLYDLDFPGDGHDPWLVVADANGNFETNWYVVPRFRNGPIVAAYRRWPERHSRRRFSDSFGIPPTITSPPQPVAVCADSSATFTVVVADPESVTYLWQYTSDNGINWLPAPITGPYGASFTLSPNVTGQNGYLYQVKVTDIFNGASTISDSVLLTVTTPVAITSQPSSQAVCVGSRLSSRSPPPAPVLAINGSKAPSRWGRTVPL